MFYLTPSYLCRRVYQYPQAVHHTSHTHTWIHILRQVNPWSLQDHKNMPQALTAMVVCITGVSQRLGMFNKKWSRDYLLPGRTVIDCVGITQQLVAVIWVPLMRNLPSFQHQLQYPLCWVLWLNKSRKVTVFLGVPHLLNICSRSIVELLKGYSIWVSCSAEIKCCQNRAHHWHRLLKATT